MNSIKIEKGAVEALKRVIRLHDKMDELLKEGDKGPSWDGDICLYTNSDLKAEHIQYTIPTQIKGKNDNRLLNKKSITFPVEYRHLRNYFRDGGVCYFVIAVSDDGEKASIFYNALTPIKLQAILKGSEKKQPEQTKNIPLLRLEKNDKDILYKLLLQFGHDSGEQGSGELVRKSISASDLKNVDSIRMTAYASDQNEILGNMQIGEVCLFGHLANSDIWVPFSYETQTNMEIAQKVKRNESFGVDGVVYYDNFEVVRKADETVYIRLSENLELRLSENKVHFDPKSDLETVIRDVRFLEAMQHGSGLYIGKRRVLGYKEQKLGSNLQKAIRDYKLLQLVTNKFGLTIRERIEGFTEDDWKALNELVAIFKGDIVPKHGEVAYHMWWWQGKIVPFIITREDTQQAQVENIFHPQQLNVYTHTDEKEYVLPIYINLTRSVWESLYDVPEEYLLEDLERYEYNHGTEGNFSLLFVELLSSYDDTGNEKYFNMARLISDKLIFVSPQNEYWKINKLQLLRRKRPLSEEEMQELESIEKNSEDKKTICAVNILLENKRMAQKVLEEMDDEDRGVFVTYPIYNLLGHL